MIEHLLSISKALGSIPNNTEKQFLLAMVDHAYNPSTGSRGSWIAPGSRTAWFTKPASSQGCVVRYPAQKNKKGRKRRGRNLLMVQTKSSKGLIYLEYLWASVCILFYVYGCCLHVSICTTCMSCACGGHKRMLEPPGTPVKVMRCPSGAGIRTSVLWKSIGCSYLLSHVPSNRLSQS